MKLKPPQWPFEWRFLILQIFQKCVSLRLISRERKGKFLLHFQKVWDQNKKGNSRPFFLLEAWVETSPNCLSLSQTRAFKIELGLGWAALLKQKSYIESHIYVWAYLQSASSYWRPGLNRNFRILEQDCMTGLGLRVWARARYTSRMGPILKWFFFLPSPAQIKRTKAAARWS